MDHRELRLGAVKDLVKERKGSERTVEYIKNGVRKGQVYVYSNDLVRVVLSEMGVYYEMIGMPEEISGVVGSGFQHEHIGSQDGLEQLEKLLRCTEQENFQDGVDEFNLMVLYNGWSIDIPDEGKFYIYHKPREKRYKRIGRIHPGELPLFYKAKWGIKDEHARTLPFPKGMMFFAAYATDQHLLVRIPIYPEAEELARDSSRIIH